MLWWVLPMALAIVVSGAVTWGEATGEDRLRRPVGSPSAEPPRPDVLRGCRTHVEGRPPPADRRKDLIIGPVRFRGFRFYSRRAARGPRSDWFEIRNREYHSLKMVTEVRAGTDVIVAIAPANRDSAGLLFDRNVRYGRWGIPWSEAEQVVRFRACAADRPASSPRFYRRRTVGPWTQFNGGLMFTGPQCLRLDVYVRGRATRRYVEPFARPRKRCPAR